MAEYLYGGMFVLACVMIYFAYSFYTGTKDLIDQGLRTKGTVVDLIQSSSEDGYTYKPVFEYNKQTLSSGIIRDIPKSFHKNKFLFIFENVDILSFSEITFFT